MWKKYKSDINQLVNERNSIAHGENGIIIEKIMFQMK